MQTITTATPTIETKKHKPIVYAVHNFITEITPIRWIPVDELCERFDQTNRQMRKIVETIACDEMFQKVIISGIKGYKVAETDKEAEEYLDTLNTTAISMFDRYWTTKRKFGKNHQMKLPIGQYDSTEFVALRQREIDSALTKSSGQVGFVL
jgi:hypothetical protein